jgi:uncharacterized membrane protein YkvA (DUF1232 family)
LRHLPDFYDHWRNQVHEWLAGYSRHEIADAVLLLPDMLALVIRLILDSRTPLLLKGQLILVAAYAFIPIDFIPEGLFGAAGLTDDAVVISVMLLRLVQGTANLDPQLLQELWPGQGSVTDLLREVAGSDGKLMNSKVIRSLLGLFGFNIPEPAVVDPTPTTPSSN